MENINAKKLIKEIQSEVISKGIDKSLVADLKKLREFALLEEKPAVVKALRLAYEHIEKNNAFLIEIPNDEPIEEAEEQLHEKTTGAESLNYFLSLLLDVDNKHNITDIKEYNQKLTDF